MANNNIPRDDLAEKGTLASIFDDPETIDEVSDIIKPEDFYDPANEIIYTMMLQFREVGKNITPISIGSELSKHDQLKNIGGTMYIAELTNPTSLAGYATDAQGYALIVKEHSEQRKLQTLGTEITRLSTPGSGLSAQEALTYAEESVFKLSNDNIEKSSIRKVGTDFETALKDIKDAGDNPEGTTSGVPTGFIDLDKKTQGFHPGEIIIVAARPAMGKAATLDTIIPTPNGEKTFKTITENDKVFGIDGKTYNVSKVHPIYENLDTYEVLISDGSKIKVNGKHEWYTETLHSNNSDFQYNETLNLKDPALSEDKTQSLKKTLQETQENENINLLEFSSLIGYPKPTPAMLKVAGSLNSTGQELSYKQENIFRTDDIITHSHEEKVILKKISNMLLVPSVEFSTVNEISRKLFGETEDTLGVEYVYNIISKSLYPSPKNNNIMTSGKIVPRVLYSKKELIESYLHHNATYSQNSDSPKYGSVKTTLEIMESLTLPGQVNIFNHYLPTIKSSDQDGNRRYIVGVNRVPSEPMRCITVDSPDSLFLVGETMVPTHNSTIAVDFARHAAILAGHTVLMFSLEMGRVELLKRIISAQTRVPLQNIKSGDVSRDELHKIHNARKEIEDSNLFIDDSPSVSLGRVRSAAMKQKLRPEGLDMIVIDYLQLMETSSKRSNASRENEVSELSRGLKILAKELKLPIIVLSQLNRGSEHRQDKTPAASDLRESGSLEQDADVIILLHRPEVYDENDRPGEADLILAKQRNGPTGKIVLVPMLDISKFANGSGVIASEIKVSSAEEETPF